VSQQRLKPYASHTEFSSVIVWTNLLSYHCWKFTNSDIPLPFILIYTVQDACNMKVLCSSQINHQPGYRHDTKVKPEAATAVIELLMMGERTPETCWAVNKRQYYKLQTCCIWLVIYLNCTMMHGFTNLKFTVFLFLWWSYGSCTRFITNRREVGYSLFGIGFMLRALNKADVASGEIPELAFCKVCFWFLIKHLFVFSL
jgi:hypothetical protein